jgi:chemotaxis protein MotA
MFHLLGFILVVVLIQSSLFVLDVEASFYVDEVAIIVVIGGTLAAGILTFKASDFFSSLSSIFKILKPVNENYKKLAESFTRLSEKNLISRTALIDATGNPDLDSFVKQGIELIVSGLSRSEVEDILIERSVQEFEREDIKADVLRKLSKYPPAFGLVGTVLGLVSLMRTIGDGANASEVGLKMALALVATLYGLTFANFVLVPLAENLTLRSEKNRNFREAEIEGLMMLYDKKSPLAVQEMMNSYLKENSRIDVIGLKSAS